MLKRSGYQATAQYFEEKQSQPQQAAAAPLPFFKPESKAADTASDKGKTEKDPAEEKSCRII